MKLSPLHVLCAVLGVSAYVACTPLPDIEDEPIAKKIVPGVENFDAAACDALDGQALPVPGVLDPCKNR